MRLSFNQVKMKEFEGLLLDISIIIQSLKSSFENEWKREHFLEARAQERTHQKPQTAPVKCPFLNTMMMN